MAVLLQCAKKTVKFQFKFFMLILSGIIQDPLPDGKLKGRSTDRKFTLTNFEHTFSDPLGSARGLLMEN